ncbi:MAG: tRNA threonylcarbamoyladenosine dehydratase [Eubacteriales bacterium]|nr:tRNA threonylcarbamoyladenosine dehydratase [Eubacteriales bacterium]
MLNQFSRTQLLLGRENMEKLYNARVAVFGIGGVGGFAVEALARSGVGSLVLIDNDKVCLSNLNRQIIATGKTIDRYKVDVMKERILEINPDANVEARQCFYLPETAGEFDFSEYSYVIDAVDTVTAKLEIIMQAKKCNVPVISCMGAGNHLDPTAFQVADIYKTTMCPLAKVMRHECKKRGIKKLKVVYSTEKPITPIDSAEEENAKNENPVRRSTPGSIAFVPSVAGLILAGEVIKDLIGQKNRYVMPLVKH